MSQCELLAKLKEWNPQELERLAAQLLVLHTPGFHGSKVIHFCAGKAKRIVDQPAAATREI